MPEDKTIHSKPRLVAHRGWRAHYPENTLAAYRAAAEAGARFVECDLQLTRDLEPVLFHDVELERVCSENGLIFDHRWETLKSLRASEKIRLGDKFSNERIPHLKDFVSFLQEHPQVRAFVEMKDESLQRYGLGSVLPRVLQALKPVLHQVNQISFSLPWCQIMRRETQYPIGFIAESYQQFLDPAVQALAPEFLCVDYKALPASGSLVQPGAALFCWEISNPELAMALHERGVDYVETYEIGEMLKAQK